MSERVDTKTWQAFIYDLLHLPNRGPIYATAERARDLPSWKAVEAALTAEVEQAGPTAVREFVEWISHHRAVNGAPHAGQAFHDYGLNTLLPEWAEEFIKGVDRGKCICDGASYYSHEENVARQPFLVNKGCPVHGSKDKPYPSQWGREDGLD